MSLIMFINLGADLIIANKDSTSESVFFIRKEQNVASWKELPARLLKHISPFWNLSLWIQPILQWLLWNKVFYLGF